MINRYSGGLGFNTAQNKVQGKKGLLFDLKVEKLDHFSTIMDGTLGKIVCFSA